MAEPLILLTNDDGIYAPGIRTLAKEVAELGEVVVVAPDREMSASSQSLTITHPLRAEQIEAGFHSVDGTPADCVILAVEKLLSRKPALVISGINRGANMGEDIFYSGTVGGAREGSFFGIPSIAVSLAVKADGDFGPAAVFARRLAALVLKNDLPPRTLLNVNVPPGAPRGVAITVQGTHEHQGTVLEERQPRRRTDDRSSGEAAGRQVGEAMPDIVAVRNGWISVTPLHTDTTRHDALALLRGWEPALREGEKR